MNLVATKDSIDVAPVNDTHFGRADVAIARNLVIAGYLVTFTFLGSIFAWAAFVPISGAAIAPGLVGKDGYRKTMQHLEGGIIHKILVKDGDEVTAGQKLIELVDLQSRSDFELMQKQRSISAAKEASLIAAQLGHKSVQLPDWLDLDSADAAVRDAINGQIEVSLFANRIHNEQLAIITKQIHRAKQKITALNDEKRVLRKSAHLVAQELAQYVSLQKKKLVPREVIFDLKRDVVENQLADSANRLAVQSTEQEVNELEMEKSRLIQKHWSQIGDELDDVREQLVRLDEKISKIEDTLERTMIRAATSGTIVNLQVNTHGGVIMPGQPLLDIVPSSGKLIIDAKIDPMDRDTVRIGQTAEIRFIAFNRRLTKPVKGHVSLISADRIIDATTNEHFYKAKIHLLENPENVLNGGAIFPGMQAEVLIITGSRTALSYLTAPISRSFNRAFRED
jgi:membrane fusion protein, type I secretion system